MLETMPLGEIAAILTAVCWSLGSMLFTVTGRKIGSSSVNHLRLWLAFLLLIPIHYIILGSFFPLDADPSNLAWLGLSGLIGYTIGDTLLFEAFVLLGARLAMLIMTLVPVFSSVIGYLLLGEIMTPAQVGAMLVILIGIAWVVTEKRKGPEQPHGHHVKGILLGVGGALGQAFGLYFAKKGMVGDVSPISANLVRISVAVVSIGLISIVRRKFTSDMFKLKIPGVFVQLTGASIVGPVIGVILSLYAIAHTSLGVASTLMSLSPLFLIPLSRFFFKEQVTSRSVIGTTVALAAASILFY